MRKRAIQKLIVNYDDGSFEEIDCVRSTIEPWKYNKHNPYRCIVCGDSAGHGGLQCPMFSSFSEYHND